MPAIVTTRATTTTKPVAPKPAYTDGQVIEMLNDAYKVSCRKWESAVAAMMTRPMSSWGAILAACQERIGSTEWNRWVSGFKAEFSKQGWEIATSRNARSGKGEFTFRTTAEGKAARAEKSAAQRKDRAAEDEKRAAEQAAKAASVTVNELVQAVLAACQAAGLNPAEVAKAIQEAIKPPKVPRPSRRRAPAESAA